MNPAPHTTYRTACGRGLATYEPLWDPNHPWILFIDGCCRRHVMSLQGADTFFHSKHLEVLVITDKEPV